MERITGRHRAVMAGRCPAMWFPRLHPMPYDLLKTVQDAGRRAIIAPTMRSRSIFPIQNCSCRMWEWRRAAARRNARARGGGSPHGRRGQDRRPQRRARRRRRLRPRASWNIPKPAPTPSSPSPKSTAAAASGTKTDQDKARAEDLRQKVAAAGPGTRQPPRPTPKRSSTRRGGEERRQGGRGQANDTAPRRAMQSSRRAGLGLHQP